MAVISVSQLNRYVKAVLERDPHLGSVYIRGEISNFKNHYASGHLYMSLKDEGAVVNAVMYRFAAQKLNFRPEDGMKVIVRAKVTLYERGGSYQLLIDEMQPDGVGALQIAFEQLKKKLAEEGLFDESRKRPIPTYPTRVGVITSETGAAVQDIRNVLGRRYPLAEIIMAPVLVQGDGAAAQIIEAIRTFNERQAADVLIVGRGGGSIEDLWAFNDEQLARTVAASRIPVISAVGHETDFTICDFVADLRAPTPSAAAELAVPDQLELQSRLLQWRHRIAASSADAVRRGRQRVDALASRRCLTSPLYAVEEQRMRLDYVTGALVRTGQQSLATGGRRLAELAGKLDALSPLKVLGRGYAIAYHEGQAVHSVQNVKVGDSLTVQVEDGRITAKVEEAVKHGTETDV